ncbi:MAG TPA: hypothetical protein VFK40_12840 [Nitrososphaeraceae archaeon]|nr:hypothetical protein [Nitrososphaeraceae archaeon]
MDQFVIITNSSQNPKEVIYFDPRVVKIQSGMSTHRLTSGNADSLLPTEFFQTQDIDEGESTTIRIESNQPAIPYYCSLHPEERGYKT